ncbi:MAG: hypothetical protein RL708_1002 [Bacteroidota bacterium]
MNEKQSYHFSDFIFIAITIAIVAAISFYIARLGFNPTDDGVILSLSRRLLMWQAPHKDFISIRPTGSGLLHLPELLFGGNFVFLCSRLVVCFQFACISLFSILLIEKASSFSASVFAKCLIFMIAFYLCIHTFPIIAWTTIDGIFCIITGTYLSTFENRYIKQIGYGIAGFAILCKQNFLLLPFLLIILNRDYKNIGVWVFTILPILVYGEMVFFSGSIKNAIEQFSSRSELFKVGIKSYFLSPYLWLGFAFTQIILWASRSAKSIVLKQLFFLLLPIILLGFLCYRNSYKAIFFLEFGILASLIVIKIIQRSNEKWFLIFVLILAWSSSISLGYNSPGLTSGIIWIALLSEIDFSKKWLNYILLFSFICSSIAFIYLRTNFIYRDKTAKELNYKLDKIYGFGGIKTNKNTAQAMNELNGICARLKNNNYCIVADYAGFWAAHHNNNLILLDWTIGDEMPTKALHDKCWKSIAGNKKIKFIIIQKYYSHCLADSLVSIKQNDKQHDLIDSVQNHYIKKWEGKYFNVFTKPMQSI